MAEWPAVNSAELNFRNGIMGGTYSGVKVRRPASSWPVVGSILHVASNVSKNLYSLGICEWVGFCLMRGVIGLARNKNHCGRSWQCDRRAGAHSRDNCGVISGKNARNMLSTL